MSHHTQLRGQTGSENRRQKMFRIVFPILLIFQSEERWEPWVIQHKCCNRCQRSNGTPKPIPLLHGSYKIHQNIFTHEQVEQYGILFETSQQYEEYLASFCQRRNEENIVNTRYINLEKCMGVCGCGKYARVFVERIPVRLNQINKIQQDQLLYVAVSMLHGFGKLYQRYKYFRVRPQMVGVDREGRVKVWINPNFSKNEHYIPVDLDKGDLSNSESLNPIEEDKMVSEIVDILHPHSPISTHQGPSLVGLLKSHKGHLSFKLAADLIESYGRQNRIEQKKYFQSILSEIHQKMNSSEDQLPQASCCSIDGNSFSPIVTKHKIIYYVNPQDHSDDIYSSESGSRRSKSRCGRKPFLQKDSGESPVSNKSMVSDPVSIHEHMAMGRKLTPNLSRNDLDKGQSSKPKIQFNYNSQNMIPKYFNDPNPHPFQKKKSLIIHFDTATPFPTLQRSSSSKSQMISKSEMISNPSNFMFSGLNEDYVLDKELMEDLEVILSQSQSQ